MTTEVAKPWFMGIHLQYVNCESEKISEKKGKSVRMVTVHAPINTPI
jgi:hypothetical protein